MAVIHRFDCDLLCNLLYFQGFCRAVLCPVGEYYVACDCIPFMHIAPFYAKIPLTVKLLHQNTSYIGVNDRNLFTFLWNLASTVTGILQDLASVEIEEQFLFNLYDVVSEKDHYYVFPIFFEILDTIQIRKSLRKIYDIFDAGIEIETGNNKFNVVFEDKFETRMETEDGSSYVVAVTMTETFANNHSVTPLYQQTLMELHDGDELKIVELAEPFRKASFCKLVCIYSNESVYTLYQNGGNQESTGLVVECSSYEGLDYIRVCSEDFEASSKENEAENQGHMVRVSLLMVSLSVITGFL